MDTGAKKSLMGVAFSRNGAQLLGAISLRITFSLLIYITNSRTKYELIVI